MIDRITARRDALAAQLEAAQQQYDALERTLHTLDRQLCAMAGGVQELDALLQEVQQSEDDDNQHGATQHADHDQAGDQ